MGGVVCCQLQREEFGEWPVGAGVTCSTNCYLSYYAVADKDARKQQGSSYTPVALVNGVVYLLSCPLDLLCWDLQVEGGEPRGTCVGTLIDRLFNAHTMC